jgi:hypothetical protein
MEAEEYGGIEIEKAFFAATGLWPRAVETEAMSGFFWITPEMAEVLLGRNEVNRNPSKDRVTMFVGAQLRGEWVVNGETIKLDENSNVIDGQHRLLSIVKSGKAMPCLVVWNLPQAVITTIDAVRPRNLRDGLALRGVKNPKNVAATINALYAYRSGHYSFRTPTLTVDQGIRLWEEERSIEESVRVADGLRKAGLRVPGGIMGALHYVLIDVDPDDADYFFEKLQTGESLESNTPSGFILKLRRAFEQQATAKRKSNKTELAALTIKAWNFFRRGEGPQLLVFRPGGRTPEAFPTPE